MTDDDKALFNDKCAEILHVALVDIRNSSYQPGNEKRINDLADIIHNLPRFMVGRDDHGADGLKECFEEFAEKYRRAKRYLVVLKMTREEFDRDFRRTDWPWPEPAEVAGS